MRFLTKGVFSTDDVRGELVAIFAAVAADVALEWVSVTMATHVDGVHDVVQEQDAAVFALEHPQLLAFTAKDADAVPGGDAARVNHPAFLCPAKPRAGSRPEPSAAELIPGAAPCRISRILSTVARGPVSGRLRILGPDQGDRTIGWV